MWWQGKEGRVAEFTHLDEDGGVSMVDVGSKAETVREAVASGLVRMSPETIEQLSARALPKGDVLTTAKIAGILAAKKTPELIPLTHPLMLTRIDLAFEVRAEAGEIEVIATVRCSGKTGVEIEAMTACAVACLTIYDMCKSAEKGITIEQVRLLSKSGGRSGRWVRG